MTSRDERSVYVTNFGSDVTEDLLKELFIQVGPVETVFVKKNDAGGRDFALIAFEHPESVLFAVETLDEIRLYNMPLSVKPKMGTEQEKAYRRNQEELRNTRLASVPGGMLLPPPPFPPTLPHVTTPNGNVRHTTLMSIPFGPGGVHPSTMAGYNTPPGYPPQTNDWRGSLPSLVAPSSSNSRNSYERDNRRDSYERRGNNYDRRSEGGRSYDRNDRGDNDRWNNGRGGGGGGGSGGRREYRDNNGERYRAESTPNRYAGREDNRYQQGNSSYRRY